MPELCIKCNVFMVHRIERTSDRGAWKNTIYRRHIHSILAILNLELFYEYTIEYSSNNNDAN